MTSIYPDVQNWLDELDDKNYTPYEDEQNNGDPP